MLFMLFMLYISILKKNMYIGSETNIFGNFLELLKKYLATCLLLDCSDCLSSTQLMPQKKLEVW